MRQPRTMAEAGIDATRTEQILDGFRGVLLTIPASPDEAIAAAALLIGDVLGGVRCTDEQIGAAAGNAAQVAIDRAAQVRTIITALPPTTATPQ